MSNTPETDDMVEQYAHLLPNWLATDVFVELARRLERERDQLARWKKEAMTVESWWAKIDAFVRSHPSVTLGAVVADEALRMLQERDELLAQLSDAEACIKSLKVARDSIVTLYLHTMVERDAFRRDLSSIAMPREAWMPKPPENLREDIIHAINCRNAESGSDTPDWILGDFLMASLAAFDEAVKARTIYFRIPDDVPAAEPLTTTEG